MPSYLSNHVGCSHSAMHKPFLVLLLSWVFRRTVKIPLLVLILWLNFTEAAEEYIEVNNASEAFLVHVLLLGYTTIFHSHHLIVFSEKFNFEGLFYILLKAMSVFSLTYLRNKELKAAKTHTVEVLTSYIAPVLTLLTLMSVSLLPGLSLLRPNTLISLATVIIALIIASVVMNKQEIKFELLDYYCASSFLLKQSLIIVPLLRKSVSFIDLHLAEELVEALLILARMLTTAKEKVQEKTNTRSFVAFIFSIGRILTLAVAHQEEANIAQLCSKHIHWVYADMLLTIVCKAFLLLVNTRRKNEVQESL